jgi:isopentenyldiphosphate isomerase
LKQLTELYQGLQQEIQEFPHRHSLPLLIAGKSAGFITAEAQTALRNHPQVYQSASGFHIASPDISRTELDRLLASIATCLHRANCTRAWRDELLNVYAEGQAIGVIERAAMRPLGLLTRAVHLNAWTPDLKIYLAKRASTKATDPGMWDTLVGGLANGIEDLEQALLRESDEEAGLEEPDLQIRTPLRTILQMHRRLPEGYQVEDIIVSDCIILPHTQPANRDGEVSEIRIFEQEEVLDMITRRVITVEAAIVLLDGLINQPAKRLLHQLP